MTTAFTLAGLLGRLSGLRTRAAVLATRLEPVSAGLKRNAQRSLAWLGRHGNLAYILTGLLFFTLIVSGYGIMNNAFRQILDGQAEATAVAAAERLTTDVPDLKSILSGEPASAQSAAALTSGKVEDEIVGITLIDTKGAVRFASHLDTLPWAVLSAINSPVARVEGLARDHAEVKDWQTMQGAAAVYYSTTLVPIVEGNRVVGAFKFVVDMTPSYTSLFRILSNAAISFGLMLAVAFGLPGIGYWLRTRQKELAEHKLDFLSQHDALTALANRGSLMRRLGGLLASDGGMPPGVAVHSMDLDHFKDINGTLGHEAGDQLLRDVANRLSSALKPGEFVARSGGDEFIIVQEGAKDRDVATDLAQRLLKSFVRPFVIADQSMRIGPSIGIALSPDDGVEPETLIRNANLALQAVKVGGRGTFKFYEGAMDEQSQRRRDIARKVRIACDNDGFQLNFQPVYSLATGLLSGFESLVRLPQEDGTMVPPSEFIAAAEELGLITKIGAWVLDTACSQAALWPHDLTVAVNISPAEFREGNVVERVAAALAKSGLKPERLEIEVTEGVLLADTETTRRTMEGLKALGVAIVLDDFGTGYSSLSYLWQFRFDKIKIDQSFVRAIGKSTNVTDIIRTIIALGRALDVRVTAEGVETDAQASVLKAMRCDLVQGYLYGMPVAQPDIPDYLTRPLPRSLAAGAIAQDNKLRETAQLAGQG